MPGAFSGGVRPGVNALVFLQDGKALLPAANFAVGGAFGEVVAEQVQVVGVAMEALCRLVELSIGAEHAELPQQGAGRDGVERIERMAQARAVTVFVGGEVGDVGAAGEDAQSRIVPGESAEQRLHGGVFELAAEPAGRLLQRLYAVEHQQGPLGGDQFGEFRALGGGISRHFRSFVEPGKGRAEEIVGAGVALGARALAIEAPLEHAPCALPAVPRPARLPLEHQCALALATLPDEGDDVDLVLFLRAAPRFVEQMQLRLATDEVLAGDVESIATEARPFY